jgi:hypothetical protein
MGLIRDPDRLRQHLNLELFLNFEFAHFLIPLYSLGHFNWLMAMSSPPE